MASSCQQQLIAPGSFQLNDRVNSMLIKNKFFQSNDRAF